MTEPTQQPASPVSFWLATCAGTVVSGSVFGVIVAGPLGFPLGAVYAGMVGIPVIGAVATLTWCLWLFRYRVVMAAVAGAATGVLSSIGFAGPPFNFPVLLAGLLGALGGGIGGGWHWRCARSVVASTEAENRAPWQFTMREMFARITSLAILFAIVSCAILGVKSAREENTRASCENNLRHVSLAVRSYEAAYGSLPPAAVVDETKTPLMSWRVLVMDFIYYDSGLSSAIDLSKPWDDPANASVLSRLGAWCFQCPSIGPAPTVNATHYVAITGPGTHWTEVGRLDEDAENDAILVVEWPLSDIQWAEPRDITPEEFVAWFESEGRRRIHPGGVHYIDAHGEVRVLRWSTGADELRELLTPCTGPD